MKFETISAADVDIIREARKALKRLQKRLAGLDKKCSNALRDTHKNYIEVAMIRSRMLDELATLHVWSLPTGDMSLEA